MMDAICRHRSLCLAPVQGFTAETEVVYIGRARRKCRRCCEQAAGFCWSEEEASIEGAWAYGEERERREEKSRAVKLTSDIHLLCSKSAIEVERAVYSFTRSHVAKNYPKR